MRTLLAGGECALMATIFDPISARIADALGCRAGLLGGSIASHAVLGAPDLILLTLTELAEQVHRCTRACNVPLLIDGDHGYGNALNVMRTIQELDAAGAAAVMVEDTVLPRAYASSEAPMLLSIDESADKVRAAVAARGDSDLLVVGRTGAASAQGADEAIVRFHAYESAGVDALFLPGLRTREELDRIAAAVRLPLVVGGVPDDMADEAYLASRKVRMWSRGHQTFAVMVQALYDAMKAVHDGAAPSRLPGVASKDLLNRVTDAATYSAWTKEFLGSERPRK